MGTEVQRLEHSHAILVVDPFLKKAISDIIKDIDFSKEHTERHLVYSKVAAEDKGILVFSDAQYLGESVIELKVNGLRKVVMLDVATSLKPLLRVSDVYPVYASSSLAQNLLPPVPSVSLLNEIAELMGFEKEVIAFTTRLPYREVVSMDVVKKKGFDVVDKNSALFYEVCRDRLDCVAIEVIDSNLAKGIDKEVVWTEGSKYYNLILDSLRHTFNKLLSTTL